jgi:2-ketocyclohexanecarboxyl-CoA hydrolase
MEELHTAIRDVPKPVIARVQGFAIGGGNAGHDLRPDHLLRQGHLRPGRPEDGLGRPGYGTAFLARVVGEKKAREIWYLNKRYSGAEAVAMGLANVCVPHDQLDAEVQKWARALRAQPHRAGHRQAQLQHGHRPPGGIAGMGMYALKLYYDTDESREGVKALKEKRKPDFRKYAK